MRFSRAFVLFLVAEFAPSGSAQEPAFEVASIRPNPSAGATDIRPMANGRLTASRASARSLILRAYGIHGSQLVGGPAWIDVDRFDIDARAAAAPTGGPEALMPMLRTLLAERFQLKVRTETRQLPAYVLMPARSDRRLGPQIRPTQADCTGARVMTREELMAVAKEGWPPCGQVVTISFLTTSSDGTSGSRIRVRRSGVTMPDFATFLQGQVGRPVVDRTGVEGLFDVEYTFAPQPPSPSTELAAGANVPPILVALEEQLGLKLEAARVDIPVQVIDSVERPTEN